MDQNVPLGEGRVKGNVNLWEQRAASGGTDHTTSTPPSSASYALAVKEGSVNQSTDQPQALPGNGVPNQAITKHSQKVVFHVYVHHEAESVKVVLEKPITGYQNLTIELDYVRGNKKYWKSEEIYIALHEYDTIRYKYIVKYSPNVFRKAMRLFISSDNVTQETYYRTLFPWIDQYGIFKSSSSGGESEIFEGQHFFVNLLYEQIDRCYSSEDFKDLMIKCERVGFGSTYYTQKCLDVFRKWIEDAVTSGVAPRKSAFIISVLGQLVPKLCLRLSAYFNHNYTVFDRLLECLQLCVKADLPTSSIKHIRSIDYQLMYASSYANGLHYISWFCHIFDDNDVLKRAGDFHQVPNVSVFDDVANKVVMQLQRMASTGKDTRQLFVFVVNEAPTISSLWTLYNIYQRTSGGLIQASEDAFVNRFKRFFSSRSTKPDLLDIKMWLETPQALKQALADFFSEELLSQMKRKVPLPKERLDSVKRYVLDRDFHRLATPGVNNILKWLVRCETETAQDILDDLDVTSLWAQMGHEEKETLVIKLFQSLSEESAIRSAKNKEKVVKLFSLMENVSQIRAWKKDKALVESLCKAACLSTEKLGLKVIVDAYESVQTLQGSLAKEWYMKSLQSKMEVAQARGGEMVTSLLNIIREGNQDAEIDGGREEILLNLLRQIKIPSLDASTECGVKPLVQAILKEYDTWRLAFEVKGVVTRLHNNPKFVSAKNALSLIADAAKEGTLNLGFFEEIDTSKLAELLSVSNHDPALASSENDAPLKERWLSCLNSFRKSRNNLKDALKNLTRVLNLVTEQSKVEQINLEDEHERTLQLKKLFQRFKYAKLIDVTQDTFWGPLWQLLQPVEKLCKYCKSTLFVNCMSHTLKTLKDEKNTAMGQAATTTVEEVLRYLSENGIPCFVQSTELLFNPDEDIAVSEVDKLFKGVNGNDLDQELEVLRQLSRGVKVPEKARRMLRDYLTYPEVHRKVMHILNVFQKVGLDESAEDTMIQVFHSFLNIKKCSTTLTCLTEALDQQIIQDVNETMDADLTDVVMELAEAEGLIQFIIKTANDNMVDLIDAVEEHSDQLIQETTVSYLIDVHRFLSGLLKVKPTDAQTFFKHLVENYSMIQQTSTKKAEKVKTTSMAAKIKICSSNVHSLRGLYMSLANRGEMTKEIIANAVKHGCYQVKTNNAGPSQVLLTYGRKDGGGSKASYEMADLHDLRSRALLIVNSDKPQNREVVENERTIVTSEELRQFIQQVDLITEITRKHEMIRDAGLPTHQEHWVKLQTLQEIQEKEKELEEVLRSWNETLQQARKTYFYLNYFHANQMWLLKRFFKGQGDLNDEDHRAVLSMFRSIDPRIETEEIQGFVEKYEPPKNHDRENELSAIGEALGKIFEPLLYAKDTVVTTNLKDATVEAGKLFVAELQPKSEQTVHVVMSLFKSATGRPPGPSQVLFCHSKTAWEEIELLLRRTFEAHTHGSPSKLHCLADVESLPNDLQFDLVDTIKAFRESNGEHYRLAVICRGGGHHHIVDQFADFAHHLGGMADAEMRTVFAETCPDVFLVASDLPGQGKTEVVHGHAAAKRKAVVHFPISGPVSRQRIIKRLSSLKIKKFHALHVSIGEVDDPLALDTLLFELIVTGMISSGTQLFHLPTKHVYIEVANTLEHWLRDSLPVLKSFRRLEGTWEDYKNATISQEATSPIQVVCQYLHALERGSLEAEEILLKPLSSDRCKQLLSKHVVLGGDPSFNILENFITVLANQLLKFTRSQFFKPHNLESMLGEGHDVRVRMFNALFEVALAFAARSVTTCKAIQSEALNEEQAREVLKKKQLKAVSTAGNMVDRVKGMIQWADNDSIVIVFHVSGSVTAVFRDLNTVPKSVKDLFKSQAVKGPGLEDYHGMSQKELQVRLGRICGAAKTNKELSEIGYALTPDNILKMALILQRMQAGMPVIVMGETGCGKTSLVKYLAATCEIPFYVFSFHAGITEEQIVEFISEKRKEAQVLQQQGKSVWIFLDEINTCDYLGTINEIICHRSIQGSPLPSNLVFVAACNPYRLRPAGKVLTAGLGGKATKDEYSRLVYRVHPLPETMIDYVWDYGSLDPGDEKAYIGRMVEGVLQNTCPKLLIALLAASQSFIRSAEDNVYCVSLRDVHRTVILIKWFQEMLQTRPDIPEEKVPYVVKKYFKVSKDHPASVRSIVLALAHCYLSRLPTSSLRRSYCDRMTQIFQDHKVKFAVNALQYVIRAEQEDYLLRMELPEGTARNAALRENVFIILVCILNRIPVFVVGKPGCSKSLSMQVIRSNLRGKDSKDPFLKTLPQLFVVSYQGSESSTSEGIEKVFEKAKKYKKADNVLPVVLLDEIGLAEVSKFNPLKVLHRLLEPGKGEFPDVAVVGISNWALDAAKMNRAIHLSRPEPDEQDLYETGLSLRAAQIDENMKHTRSGNTYGDAFQDDDQLRSLAEAYYHYQRCQKRENFHGLRDYYSMVKCISLETNEEEKYAKIQQALQRNFGGLPSESSSIQKVFVQKLEELQGMEEYKKYHVADLIRDNLHDRLARHLMIITNGDSAIGILDQTLADLNKEKITIFGSRFEEDLSADYNYRVLSRIILCMERDCVLILRDLENIYGSLYDMLNQNYTVVGGKKNCRIALGAFSNPMCQVHDGFRCIVLVEQSKVDYTDPPFLNRFEKQLLRFSDVLNEEQAKIIRELQEWIEDISSVEEHESEFDETDMFAGFHEDTLPSLVLDQSSNLELSRREVIERCKKALMDIASPDAVMRSLKSVLHCNDDEEVDQLHHDYFRAPVHRGLKCYLEQSLNESNRCDEKQGKKLLIMTHSNIHADVGKELQDFVIPQVEKLSSFKSEKQLSKRVKHFWTESEATLLVLQCNPENDSSHMLLAKSIIELQREEYIRDMQNVKEAVHKHVCIVIHLPRDRPTTEEKHTHRWQFNFLSGWTQVMVDELEAPAVPVVDLLEVSVVDALGSDIFPFQKVLENQLLWCFTRIKYPPSRHLSQGDVVALTQRITSTSLVTDCFQELCCRWIERQEDENNNGKHESWQVAVACDRQALVNSSTIVKALERFVNNVVRQPLAKIIYFMENESLWDCIDGSEEKRLTWKKLMLDARVLSLDALPDTQGAESLVFRGTRMEQMYPFSALFCKVVDGAASVFMEQMRLQQLNESNLHKKEEGMVRVADSIIKSVSMVVEQRIPVLLESDYLCSHMGDYIDDVLDLKSEHFAPDLSREERVRLLKSRLYLTEHGMEVEVTDIPVLLIRLHSAFWELEDSAMMLLEFVSAVQKVVVVDLCKSIDSFHGITEAAESETKEPEFAEQGISEPNMDEDEGAVSIPNPVQETTNVPGILQEMGENIPQEHDEQKCEKVQAATAVHVDLSNEDVEKNKVSLGKALGDSTEDNKESSLQDTKGSSEGSLMGENGGDDHIAHDGQDHSTEKNVANEGQLGEKAQAATAVHVDLSNEDYSEENKESLGEALGDSKEDNKESSLQDTMESSESSLKGENGGDDHIAHDVQDQSTEKNAANEGQEEIETIDGFLVKVFCKAIVPTKELISSMGGVEKWEKSASLVLSLASKMQTGQPVFFFLKVCYDFTTLVLLPEALKPEYLYLIGELGSIIQVEKEGYLDSVRCFEDIYDAVDGIRDEVEDMEKLTTFLYIFFARCIDANPDTPSIGTILRTISQSGDDRLLGLAYPIIYRILLSERQAFTSENYGQILSAPNDLEDFPNLIEISNVLAEGDEVDPQFVVMCCDLISQVAFKDLKLESLSASENPALQNFRRALEIVLDCNVEPGCGRFAVLCSIPYIRSFLNALAQLIHHQPSCLSSDGEYTMLIDDISAAFQTDTSLETAREEIRLFLLKELRDTFSMAKVQQLCEESTKVKFLKEFKWREVHSCSKLSLDPFLQYQGSTDAEVALGNLTEENPTPMLELLAALDSSEKRMELAAVFLKAFYLVRSIRNIKDTEDKTAKFIGSNLKKEAKPFAEFLLRVINQEDFGSQELNISPESPQTKVQMAAMLMHFAALLTSHYSECSKSTLVLFLTNPTKLNNSSVLSAPESTTFGCHRYSNSDSFDLSQVTGLHCNNCHGFAAVGQESASSVDCPDCKSPLTKTEDSSFEDQPAVCKNGYIICEVEELADDMACVRNLSPVEFRILHLLVHSAMFLGSAMGLVAKETLSQFLSKDDPQVFCMGHVQNDIDALRKLLCCQEEQIVNLLHVAIKDIAPVLLSDFGIQLPHDRDARLEWESRFAGVIRPVIEKFRRSAIKPLPRAQNVAQDLEDQIEEVGHPQPGQGHPSLPLLRLFRKRKPKSFEDLRSHYMNSPPDVKRKHALLGLLLDYHDKLSIVGNLVSLTAWSRLVDSLLSRRLTREDAKKKIIADCVIRIEECVPGKPKGLSKENLEQLFEDFRKAWERVLPHVQHQFGDENPVPFLSDIKPVGYCLVESQEEGQYLSKILSILANIQNEFLDKVLSAAASGQCSALEFLRKGESASFIPSVHVQEARESEIIQYEWTDLFLLHAQHNTEYGHGTEIIYDLAKIEKEMAGKFILGKAYLTTSGGLREFVFSKQLFHDCADILNELELAVPQKPLPDDVERGLISLMEKSLENIQTLLVNMEIILCFLKRTGGKPEESLVNYTDSWVACSCRFSKELFPEPKDAIKLKHVAALYESCEDKLSGSVAECVGVDYRKVIPEEAKRRMNECDALQEKGSGRQSDLPEAAVVALKRFIFRYLSMKPGPGRSLKHFMADASLWPIGIVGETQDCKYKLPEVLPQLFPDTLTVGHAHSVLDHYQDYIDRSSLTRRPTIRRASGMPPRLGQTGSRRPATPGGRGRRSHFGSGFS